MTTSASSVGRPTFGERFLERSQDQGQLCVGMDPHVGILEDWGLKADVAGLESFSKTCVEAFEDVACVVKPQVAFYEQFGSAGLAVLERSIAELRKAGVLVIADAKRGDIGSTMAGYARAWLDPDSPLCSDAVTVSPWLGFDSLRPVIDLGEQHGRGVIVLAATSNPGGAGPATLLLRRHRHELGPVHCGPRSRGKLPAFWGWQPRRSRRRDFGRAAALGRGGRHGSDAGSRRPGRHHGRCATYRRGRPDGVTSLAQRFPRRTARRA